VCGIKGQPLLLVACREMNLKGVVGWLMACDGREMPVGAAQLQQHGNVADSCVVLARCEVQKSVGWPLDRNSLLPYAYPSIKGILLLVTSGTKLSVMATYATLGGGTTQRNMTHDNVTHSRDPL
jgi:hypothetical protein